ncbi:MAG: AAA-like domain-containing protein [Cyanobacteriota bacterium]|jgi:WD40 repeat protein
MADLSVPHVPTSPYRVGGSLSADHVCYVERRADGELQRALTQGEFCYAFNCRQMGKSSLRVRAMERLKSQGDLCASVDITSLGNESDPHKWYNGLISQLFLGFGLVGRWNLKTWLRERDHLSPVQKLGEFLEAVLQIHFPEKKIYIFIDEIDKVLSLPFSLDDFFAYIRYCYNQRAEHREFNRLTFALFGVAAPTDLIQDKTQTPFNIGIGIELTGFTLGEIAPLAVGLAPVADHPLKVLEAILSWTGGQPFLTQKLCDLVLKQNVRIGAGQETEAVNAVVEKHLLTHWESQDEPIHFRTLRDRLFRNPHQTPQLLALYQEILERGSVNLQDSAEETELRLTGLAVKQNNQLQVYNRLYREIFSADWARGELAKLRPYSESFLAWRASGYQDESRLLRGQALQDALVWAQGKTLSSQDYQYLNASQGLEQRATEAANQILKQANQRARRLMAVGLGVLTLSLLGSAAALRQAYLASQQQALAQRGTEIQRRGESGARLFETEQLPGLIAALTEGQALQTLVSPQTSLRDYPATSPLLALQTILGQIREKNSLGAHREGVTSVAFSPDGQILATGSRDQTVKLWTNHGQLLQTLRGHNGAVYRVAFSPDGQTLASAGQDGTIKLWSREGGLLKTLTGHDGSVYGLSFSPDGEILASTGRDKTARLWSRDGSPLQVLTGHRRSADDVKFSPDGQTLATVSRDGQIRLWSRDGRLLNQFGADNTALFSLSFSADGQRLAAGGDDGVARIWNRSGTLLQSLRGHLPQEFVTAVLFDPKTGDLFSAASDGLILRWSAEGERLESLAGHREAVFSLALAGSQLASASEEGVVKLWDIGAKPQGGCSLVTNPNQRPSGGAFLPDGGLLLAQEDQPLTLVNSSGQLQQSFPPETRGLTRLRVGADGRLIAGLAGNTLQVWTREGQLQSEGEIPGPRLYDLQFSPDAQTIALGNRSGEVQVWDWVRGQISDIRYQISISRDQLADNQNSQSPNPTPYSPNPLRTLAFHPRKNLLAGGDDSGQISLWSSDGTLLWQIPAHRDWVEQVRFSSQGNRLYSSGRDGRLLVWSEEGRLIQTLAQESQALPLLALSRDGEWLAGALADGGLRLWDKGGTLWGEWLGAGERLLALDFSADGREILALTATGKLHTWRRQTAFELLGDLNRQGCEWLREYLEANPPRRRFLPGC